MRSQDHYQLGALALAVFPMQLLGAQASVPAVEGRSADLTEVAALWTSLALLFSVCGILGRWATNRLQTPPAAEPLQAGPCNGAGERPAALVAGTDDRAKLVQRFLDQGRTAILLRSQIAKTLDVEDLAVVRHVFQQGVALVDGGEVVLMPWTFEESEPAPGHIVKQHEQVSALYMDRYVVTNGQFHEFVADGAYGQPSLWEASIWPRVSEFVDRTGAPGPRFWQDSTYPAAQHEWPVVGVSWYEADAFARWSGRRLPTDAEWVKAATCPVASAGKEVVQRRFPWGDMPDAQRANLWITGLGQPTGVAHFPNGASSVGIQQLIGNVWEWTACDVRITSYGREVRFEVPLKSLRGGAFDTYFENQATCQLQSGDSPLARRHNIGFRCAISASDIIDLGASG